MDHGCIAGTGRAVIVYLLCGIEFVGRPEAAFSLSDFAIPRFQSNWAVNGAYCSQCDLVTFYYMYLNLVSNFVVRPICHHWHQARDKNRAS